MHQPAGDCKIPGCFFGYELAMKLLSFKHSLILKGSLAAIFGLTFVVGVFAEPVTGGDQSDPECRDGVDSADDMSFADAIVECDNQAVILYDAESRSNFLNRRKLPLKTYEKQAGTTVAEDILVDQPVHVPGTTFVIRARYSIESPASALSALHQEMATYCPMGWDKDREWSTPVERDYYLHYQFTCADPESDT